MLGARTKASELPGDGVHLRSADLIALRNLAQELGLSAAQRVRSHQAGGYLSVFRGAGMDFEESRPYQPGDDVRNIDWRVTARSNRTHTKVFNEEHERPVYFLVDLSANMRFATRGAFKSVRAAQYAAMLAWAAVANGDRVGALISAGAGHRELRPMSREGAALRMIRELVQLHEAPAVDGGGKGLSDALGRLNQILRPGSQVFIISDFNQFHEDAGRRLAHISKAHPVVAIAIHDHLEQYLPAVGSYPITDGRQFQELQVSSATQRLHYQARFDERRDALRRLCRRVAVHLVEVNTAMPVLESLRSGLHATVRHSPASGRGTARG